MSEERTFKCSCGKKMVIPPELVGKALKCPRCGVRVAPSPAVTDLSDTSGGLPGQNEEEEGVLDREDRARSKSSRRAVPGRREEKSSKRPAESERPAEDPRSAKPPREASGRPPRALDAVRGQRRLGSEAEDVPDLEETKPMRRDSASPSKRREEAPSEAPPPRETSKRPLRGEASGREKPGLDRRSGRKSTREDAEPAAESPARSKRAAGVSRRAAAATAEPESPGVLSLVGLVGATFQMLTGLTLAAAALTNPALLRPAGFEVQAGTGKTVVIAFGVLFLVAGLATEFALFKYIRNAGRLEAAGGGGSPEAGSRRSRRSPVDEGDLDSDLGGDEDLDDY